ncbi:MAG: tyrosine-type recombinase/integrase [Syntrophomonadaceae bacterium]|jgi:integrase|nr:tyrosine-type recombinase/integrase [Syntrophomonadaceae bacterium]
MEYVNPIKDVGVINEIKESLKQKAPRDFLLFVLGINTGIRICDLLNLKVNDVWDGEKVKEFLFIAKNGRHKETTFYINNNVREALNDYILATNLKNNDFLFKSKNHDKPISRQQAYRIINKAAREVGVQGEIGTHTIRKTFGYHAYRKGIAISILRSIFGHSCPSETLRYIGIDKDHHQPIKVDVNL